MPACLKGGSGQCLLSLGGQVNTHTHTHMSTRPCCSSHESATPATWMHVTHTPHHQPGKQSTSSNGSHGQGHGQAPQLQTAHEQPKIHKSMEPVSSQQISTWFLSSALRPMPLPCKHRASIPALMPLIQLPWDLSLRLLPTMMLTILLGKRWWLSSYSWSIRLN